jgi:SAM-dependent methyltransferase
VALLKRLGNIIKYGLGPRARERKRADKAKARQASFESSTWNRDEDLAQRNYGSYEEYLTHQSAKLDAVSHRLAETAAEDLADFKHRFAHCPGLTEARTVLCLGARLGTEVKALHALGYFAVGIDLNPGENNLYVLPGDFHAIVFPDGSVDAVYTNALDHVFDLDKVLGEVNRLLRPGGLFVVDMLPGYEEGFTPGAYEATHWRKMDTFIERLCGSSGLVLEGRRDLGQIRRDRWFQVTLRKPA